MKFSKSFGYQNMGFESLFDELHFTWKNCFFLVAIEGDEVIQIQNI